MNEKQIEEKLNALKHFKNARVYFNNETELCDIYLKCSLPEEELIEKIAKIEDVNLNPCNNGIFEILFDLSKTDTIIEKICKEFK